jgi:hypothetical protein
MALMDESKQTGRRNKAWLGLIISLTFFAVSGCGKKEDACIPITRWENFYVGMSYEEAKKYLPDGVELGRTTVFKDREPERGEDIYGVRVETDDGWYALGFDKSKTLVRIGVGTD